MIPFIFIFFHFCPRNYHDLKKKLNSRTLKGVSQVDSYFGKLSTSDEKGFFVSGIEK